MVKSSESCLSLPTSREKRWPYEEYYFGQKDSEGRKNGQGEQHWTGAESLEWYIGPMLHDTMHGSGDYRWRYKDPDGSFVTYEGRFFANQMHGYGVMSYPDGRVFTGLFYKDIRWGPGVERLTNLKSNVGFWRGPQLARLIWRPTGPTIAPNLAISIQGLDFLDEFRTILVKKIKIIGETNPAIERLKWYGANPMDATKKWQKLYPKYCTDVNSVLFHKDLFEYKYYGMKINSLTEAGKEEEEEEYQVRIEADADADAGVVDGNKSDDRLDEDEAPSYFSWNNNAMIMHMMKHCYKHEQQRHRFKISLQNLLNGPRKKYRPASAHELNCRSLLLASFVGDITNVAQLVNENDVYPDVADSQGNTALMYATCGDQTDVMHFLVEAGAIVNSYNDSCCTPLGVALLRYLCVANDVPRSAMLNALLPQKVEKFSLVDQRNNLAIKSVEWQITRDMTQDNIMQKDNKSQKSSSKVKVQKNQSLRSSQSMNKRSSKGILERSSVSKAAVPTPAKPQKKGDENEELYDSDDEAIFSDEKKLFMFCNREYCAAISDQFAALPKSAIVPDLFTIRNIVKDIDAVQEEFIEKKSSKTEKKAPPKIKSGRGSINKIKVIELKETDDTVKIETLSKIKLGILQLLTDGADPTLVRCPQPAILLAVKSGSSEMVKHMVSHGVDVNEKFPKWLDYTALDIMVSEPFSADNLEMIRTLLEIGADARHRLKTEDAPQVPDQPPWDEGPNLLHAVIMKNSEFQFEADIRRKTIEVLLQYNADPTAMYKGQTPIECTMVQDINLLEPFILHPSTDLNAIINNRNHTILMKLFTKEYFKTILGVDKMPIITSLLLYGADPLIECYDDNERYQNLFYFARKNLDEMAPPPLPEKKSPEPGKGKGKAEKDNKNKGKSKASQSKSKLSSKLKLPLSDKDKPKSLEFAEYQDAISMMTECSRLLYVRWLQAKLLKELINVIHKFKPRHWTMIIKENNHENAYRVGLWVNSTRCIEIWDILENSNNRKYKDENVLRKLLRIVQFYQKRLKENMGITPTITTAEKNVIEAEVGLLMKEHRIARSTIKDEESWKRPYVKPELASEAHKKFQVCFECSLPLGKERMVCEFCGMVSFCELNCLTSNVDRLSGHPCNEKLREKYCPFVEDDGSSPEVPSLIASLI